MKQFNAFLVMCLLLLSMFTVQAVAPITYNKEVDADVELRGAIFTTDATDYYASYNEDSKTIQLDYYGTDHPTSITFKIKGIALENRLKNYDGFKVGYTHIANDGTVTYEIKSLEIDYQGFAYLTCDFSTVIINGMTGYTTTTYTSQNGNQSFSVPGGSSYDLNITNNQEGLWTAYSDNLGNTSTFENRTSLNVSHSGALSGYQYLTTVNYSAGMNTSFDDIRVSYENGTYIPYKIINKTDGVSADVWFKVDFVDGDTTVLIYYGNDGLSSKSSGADTFIQWHGVASTNYHDTNVAQVPFIVESKIKRTASNSQFIWGVSNIAGIWASSDDNIAIAQLDDALQFYTKTTDEGTSEDTLPTYTWNLNQFYNTKIVAESGSSVKFYDEDGNLQTTHTTYIPDESMGLTVHMYQGTYEQDWSFIRQYTAIEPTSVWGAVEQATGTVNITASITGDTSTQSYNTSESKEFTLTPTEETNNVLINTTCTDYDVIITTYWTEDTTLIEETASLGYAKQFINYTPSENITSADLNTTFTFDFSVQDYIGTTSSTLNDISKTTTRDGQDINASVGSLTVDTPYWWNVTVPYNNIFTLSNQSDQTAYLGISKEFTDSVYTDPEGLEIDTRLWKFGDGVTNTTSNPSHTYSSLGVKTANYTVTETATVSPQTVIKEFTVTVAVQPPQNLTYISHQTTVDVNWDDYISADKYSVYELVDGFAWSDTSPTIDGIKDAYYDNAHQFLIFSPNPVNAYDYEPIWAVHTVDGAYFYIESTDNDAKTGDDDTIFYISRNGVNLTVGDPAYKVTDNQLKKYLWNGADWAVTGVIDAEAASVGGGTFYPKHELFIPVAELGGDWINESTVKVLVKREDSSLSPDVVTYYPYGNQNDTDVSLWQDMKILTYDEYTWLANVTLSNYTATNLTPFTWYYGGITSWNGTTESAMTTGVVITTDIERFTVSGYILDSLGAGIAGATVWAQNGCVGEITQTDANGLYTGYNFCTGNYTIYANKSAYAENYIDIYVSENMTNQNITLTSFEMTDWMLWNKLLEIEDLLTIEESAPTEITKMTYQIFILLIIIDLLAVWYSFTHTDKSYYTDIITSLLSVIISGIISYNSIIGVSYYFATQSTVHEIEYTSISLMVLFGSVSIVMLIFFITKILELTHTEVDQL